MITTIGLLIGAIVWFVFLLLLVIGLFVTFTSKEDIYIGVSKRYNPSDNEWNDE